MDTVKQIACPACEGSGTSYGHGSPPCSRCRGARLMPAEPDSECWCCRGDEDSGGAPSDRDLCDDHLASYWDAVDRMDMADAEPKP